MGLRVGSTSQQYLDMYTGIGTGLCPCLGLWFHYINPWFFPKKPTDSFFLPTMKREERAIQNGYIGWRLLSRAVAGVKDMG